MKGSLLVGSCGFVGGVLLLGNPKSLGFLPLALPLGGDEKS